MLDVSKLNPTDEQLSILSHVRGSDDNFIINALAGTGKTSTLQMVEGASSRQPILYLAFNKRIAQEAETKFSSTTTVRTLNSLGHRVWAKTQAKNLSLDPKKTQAILRQIISDMPKSDQSAVWQAFWPTVEAVGMAKALGYVPEGKFPQSIHLTSKESFHASLDEPPDEFTADLIDAVLTLSIRHSYAGSIDYNDQLYMPALFGGTFPRFPLVLADEVQDFNPVNHQMLGRLVSGRLGAVGDPWQSIYEFRGAKRHGMEALAERFSATPFTLSVSFRCPQAIVEAARGRVPEFKWMKEGGHVEELKELGPKDIPDDAAIICRNNAPLFRCGMQLLRAGRGVSIAGSDVGPKLVGILRKLGPEDMPRASVLSAIEDWRAERLAKGSATANDLADCMRVFTEVGRTLSSAVAYAEHLFAQKGSIRLLTGHKAKGLEWSIVYFLDPWLIREDEDQDLNLRYVIQTRAQERLFMIDSRNIKWSKECLPAR